MFSRDGAMLRLELNIDSLRMQIMQALDLRHGELQAIVNDEVERTSRTLEATIREAVRKGVDNAIRQAVEAEMFRVRQAIQPGIAKAISDLLPAATQADY